MYPLASTCQEEPDYLTSLGHECNQIECSFLQTGTEKDVEQPKIPQACWPCLLKVLSAIPERFKASKIVQTLLLLIKLRIANQGKNYVIYMASHT